MGIEGFDWSELSSQQQQVAAQALEKRKSGICHQIGNIRKGHLEGKNRLQQFVFNKVMERFGLGETGKSIKNLIEEHEQITQLLQLRKPIRSVQTLNDLDSLIEQKEKQIKELTSKGVATARSLQLVLPSKDSSRDIQKLTTLEGQLRGLNLIKKASQTLPPGPSPSQSVQDAQFISELKQRVSTMPANYEERIKFVTDRVLTLIEGQALGLESAMDVTQAKISDLQQKLESVKKSPSESAMSELENSLDQIQSLDDSVASFEELVDDASDESMYQIPGKDDLDEGELELPEESTLIDFIDDGIEMIVPEIEEVTYFESPVDALKEKIAINEQRYQQLKNKIIDENRGHPFRITPKAKETLRLLKEEQQRDLQQLNKLIHEYKGNLGEEKFTELSSFIGAKMKESAEVTEARILKQLMKGKRSPLLEAEVLKTTSTALRTALNQISIKQEDLEKQGNDAKKIYEKLDQALTDADFRINSMGLSIAAKLLQEKNHKKRALAKMSLAESALAFGREGNYVAMYAIYAALNSSGLQRPAERGYEVLGKQYEDNFKELTEAFGIHSQLDALRKYAKTRVADYYLLPPFAIKQLAVMAASSAGVGKKNVAEVGQSILHAVSEWTLFTEGEDSAKEESALMLEGNLFNNIPADARRDAGSYLISLSEKIAPKKRNN